MGWRREPMGEGFNAAEANVRIFRVPVCRIRIPDLAH